MYLRWYYVATSTRELNEWLFITNKVKSAINILDFSLHITIAYIFSSWFLHKFSMFHLLILLLDGETENLREFLFLGLADIRW